MSGDRTTIPEWELKQLRAITDGETAQDREAALLEYLHEREKRKRYARVRDARDKERRTLVGAHLSRADAEMIRFIADREDLSVTAFVRFALQQAMENSELGRGGVCAVSVPRR